MIPPILLRFLPHALAVVAVGAAVGGVVHVVGERGEKRGQAARDAFYQPILDDWHRKVAEQEAWTQALVMAHAAEKAAAEEKHANYTKALADRSTSAEQRLTALLRQRTANRACQMPAAAGAADTFAGATERFGPSDAERESALRDLVGIAREAEDNAKRLDELRAFYELERSRLAR